MPHHRPWHLGLTGGIGSGKSTVASLLARLGAAVVDADAISRQLTLPSGAAMPAIAREFGAQFVAADGGLDRHAMRARVFAEPAARGRLEAIIHPLVGEETARQAQRAAEAGVACVVFDVPLLVESGRWRPRLDAVLVVDCTEERQIERVMQRSAWTREAVESVLRNQASRLQRLAAADVCIDNQTPGLAALEGQVQEAWRHFGL